MADVTLDDYCVTFKVGKLIR